MTFDSILNSLINEKDATLTQIDNLIYAQGSKTLLTDSSVAYTIPTPTYNETNDEWVLVQSTADTDGLYKGLYQLALSTGCAILTIVSHNVVTPDDGIPARRMPYNGSSLIDVATISSLNGQQIKKVELRSKNPFTVTVKLADNCWGYRLWTWDFAMQGQGEWLVNNLAPTWGTFAGSYWLGTDVGNSKQISIQMNLDLDWVMHGFAMTLERTNGSGIGNQDLRALQLRPQRNTNTGLNTISTGLTAGAGNGLIRHFTHYASGVSLSNYGQILFSAGVTDNGASSTIKIHKLEILFAKNAAKGGNFVNSKDMSLYS